MFSRTRVFRFYVSPFKKICRTFLSEEYKCTTEWQSRLSAPFMNKVNLDSLYYDIDQAFQQQRKASPIDVDIFVNKVTELDDTHVDEIGDLLHRLRLTEETSNTLESTGHAVIRNFLEMGHIDELIQILDDRISYGVFLDHYIANYALDKFIKKKDFNSAARIATFLMLQEDFDNEISKSLALLACYRYLDECKPFYPPKEENKEEESKEEVKVRVKFIRNEFFDDHFDLRDHKHLVGKTMAMIGKKIPSQVGKNAELLGWILYQKFDKALEVLKSAESDLIKNVVLKCIKHCPEEENESLAQLKTSLNLLSSSNKVKDISFEEELEKLAKEAVSKNEPAEIDKQKKIYSEWNQIREKKLQEEQERLLRAKRLKEIEKLTEDMKREEEKLWFFENEDKIDLQIDSKIIRYPKRWFGKKKKPRVVDEDYVPPEIVKQQK